MGIQSFTKIIDILLEEKDVITRPIDSILIDVQSLLYIAIDQALEPEESNMIKEICICVQEQIKKIISDILKEYELLKSQLTIILSFDGEGVPMKWPTQRQRRFGSNISGKNVYKISLFGNNEISRNVQNKLVSSLKDEHFYSLFQKRVVDDVRICVSGCNVEGEGEHKLFNLAEEMQCKHPVIVSMDNDIFILSFLRIDRYDTIQLFKKQNRFYNLTQFVKEILPYPLHLLISASFLFGNDFLPSLLTITNNNVVAIHDALATCQESDLPDVIRWVLEKCRSHMRFKETPSIDRELVVQFWITCLWVLDYYTQKNFSQKWTINKIYDQCNRNMILTALLDSQLARETYQEALSMYKEGKVESTKENAKTAVFNETTLTKLSKYFLEQTDDKANVEIRASKRLKTL